MRKIGSLPVLLVAAALLAACSDTSDKNTQRATEPDSAPKVDRDPNPDTGTGGEVQTPKPAPG